MGKRIQLEIDQTGELIKTVDKCMIDHMDKSITKAKDKKKFTNNVVKYLLTHVCDAVEVANDNTLESMG